MIEEVAEVCLAEFIFNLAMMLFTSRIIALCAVFLCCKSTVLFLPRLNVVSGVAEKSVVYLCSKLSEVC